MRREIRGRKHGQLKKFCSEGKERDGVVAARICEVKSCFFFKMGKLTACVYAEEKY